MEPRNHRNSRRGATIVLLIFSAPVTLSCSYAENTKPSSPAVAASEAPVTVSAAAQPTAPASEEHNVRCEQEHERLQSGMREIYLDFQRSTSPRPMKVLVNTDRRVRALLNSRPRSSPCLDDEEIYDPQWAQMGVELGYWAELTYNGALLCEAHKRDPNSALRKYTLYATVFGTTPYHGLGGMPDIEAAFTYESEFPHGPFVKETLLTIAAFHKDLFMVLRDERRDYKYDCFKRYIGKTAVADQKKRAKRIALAYYRKVLKLDPSNEQAMTFLKEVELETVKSWSFCSD